MSDDLERSRTARAAGLALLVGVVLLLVVVVALGPRIRQWMLPPYATPEAIETAFGDQIRALEEVAFGRVAPRQAAEEFASPEIDGAFVISCYGDSGKAMILVKDFSPEYDEASESGIWFETAPGPVEPVVNIWGGRIACYERKLETPLGLRGVLLCVSVDALKRRAGGWRAR